MRLQNAFIKSVCLSVIPICGTVALYCSNLNHPLREYNIGYAGDSPANDTCGLKLSTAASQLLHDVEREYGKQVQCETRSNLQDAEGGIALESVASDGTPLITLDIFAGKTETSFVHELFHLQLRRSGFQQDFRLRLPPNVHRPGAESVGRDTSSLIEHRLFFGRMRKMGLNPTEHFRKDVEDDVVYDRPPAYAGKITGKLATGYAYITLLIRDQALTRKVGAWYAKHGWSDELTRGKLISQYLTTYDPDTPEKKRIAFEHCMDIALGTKIVME